MVICMNSIWERDNYRSPINFIIGDQIREYDMTKANISVLRDADAISEEQYQYFLICPKIEREIAIGKMRGSDPRLTAILKEGIKNARQVFMESNNIDDKDILAIRNDAITVVGYKAIRNLNITNRVAFRLDGLYSSFYHINHLDLLYLYDSINNKESLDIKGMSDEAMMLHKEYFLDLLSEVFCQTQVEGIMQSIRTMQNFHNQYINLLLPVEYYRELNSNSRYRLNNTFSTISILYLDNAIEPDKGLLDISYNEKILRLLNQYYSSIYFGQR